MFSDFLLQREPITCLSRLVGRSFFFLFFFAVAVKEEGICYTVGSLREGCLTLWDLNPSWLQQRMRRVWCGFVETDWTSSYLLCKAYLNALAVMSVFFFFLIADVKSKLFFFKTNSTKELREHNFFYTSKSKRAGLSFRATNNEGQFPFHKFCVSPNSPANEVFPGFFKVKSNELFHHEATAVSDGNSWPNTYSCWDRSSQFSPFMTKL